MDDFIYFSESDEVEKEFERKFGELTTVDFMGTVSYFLGILFQYRQTQDNLKVHLSKQAFSENLLQSFQRISISTNFGERRLDNFIQFVKSFYVHSIRTTKHGSTYLVVNLSYTFALADYCWTFSSDRRLFCMLQF